VTGQHYDIIIIGTGAGGGTLAYRLAPTGKNPSAGARDFPAARKENGIQSKSFKDRYHTTEVWYTKQGEKLHPGYWVGGNTKVFGGALFRLRNGTLSRLNIGRHFSSMALKIP